jgi:enamidase
LTAPVLAQTNFSDETRKYIEYNDSIIVFKNALLIDGKANPPKPNQTVIIRNGKIEWLGDDAKAIVPKAANIVQLNGKALMPGFVMLHEHMYISAFDVIHAC